MPLQMVPSRRLHAVQRVMPVLLRAGFGAPVAAPLPSPLGVDVGSLSVADANSIMSQAGGVLVINGTPTANDGLVSPSALPMVAGRAMLVDVPTRTAIGGGNSPRLGLSSVSLPSVDLGFGVDYASATDIRIKRGVSVVDTVTIGSGRHCFAFVQRGGGGLALARNGTDGPYTLLYPYPGTLTIAFAKVQLPANAVNFTLDDLRVVDLPYPWTDPYGIAQSHLVNPAALAAFPHTQDVILDYSFTFVTGQQCRVDYRRVDSSNSWAMIVLSNGNLQLTEIVAGVLTARGTSATAYGNGTVHRMLVVAEGNVHKVYSDDVLKITYTDPSNLYLNQTNGLTRVVGSPISDFVAWPRRVALPEAA